MVTRLRQKSPSIDVLHTFNPWSYNGWFRRGFTWELQNLVICRFRSGWGTWQSFYKWLSSRLSRTQYILSTHSFFQEAGFNGYMSSTEAEVTAANLALRAVGQSYVTRGEIALNKSSPAEWKLVPRTQKIRKMTIGSTFLSPIKLPEFMSNPQIKCITQLTRIVQWTFRVWQGKGILSWKRKLVMLNLIWHGTGRLLMLMLSMTFSGLGKPFSGFLDQMKWTTGLNHVRSDQLWLISSMWGLKSGGWKCVHGRTR